MAQQKKTEDVDFDALEDLKPKERVFCEGILKGLSGADAYRQAFDPEGKLADTTVWTEASKLKNSSKVALWLLAAREAGFADSKITLENHLEELAKLRDIARSSGNLGAAVQAEQLRGKVGGYYVERIKDETESLPDGDLVTILRNLLGDEVADKAAEALGEARH